LAVARRRAAQSASLAVQAFLLPAARIGPVVLLAALIGTPATMVLPAAERTAEILAAGVTGMREEADAAVATAHRAVLQIRTIPQDGIQRELILTDKRINTLVLVPIFRKIENLLERYEIKARFSVMMWILLCMTSS
jgi:hypothetical protein